MNPTTWTDAPVSRLVEHICSTHHTDVKTAMPRVARMLDDVAERERGRYGFMAEVARRFRTFSDEMLVHMRREAIALFPAILDLDGPPHGDVSISIRIMQCDHLEALQVLKRLRELTSCYTAPEGASPKLHAALEALADVDAQLIRSIQLEDDVLFRRVLESP